MTAINLDKCRLLGYAKTTSNAPEQTATTSKLAGAKVGLKDGIAKVAGAKVGLKPFILTA